MSLKLGNTFDGVSGGLVYPLRGGEFDSDEISILIGCSPVFDYTEDKLILFFDTDASSKYRMYKLDNAGGNSLVVYLGNTQLLVVSPAIYSQYWVSGGRNEFVIVGNSGVDLYLNNNLIGSVGTAWTPKVVNELYIGSANNGAALFEGAILEFKVFKSILIPQEITDFYTHSTYNYRNKAVLDLPMRAAQHVAGDRTLDVSGFGNDAFFNGGAPAKLSKRGYRGFGSSRMDVLDDASVRPTKFTAAILCRSSQRGNNVIFESGDGNAGFSIQRQVDNAAVVSIGGSLADSNNNTKLSDGAPHTYIVTHEGAGQTSIFLDGVYDVAVDNTSTPLYVNGGLNIFSRDGLFGYNGDIYQIIFWNFVLTPIQVADLHGKMMRSINAV
jgi:hypothetical protein